MLNMKHILFRLETTTFWYVGLFVCLPTPDWSSFVPVFSWELITIKSINLPHLFGRYPTHKNSFGRYWICLSSIVFFPFGSMAAFLVAQIFHCSLLYISLIIHNNIQELAHSSVVVGYNNIPTKE